MRYDVQHMIEAAEAVRSFIADRQRIDLDSDKMLLFALVRAVGTSLFRYRPHDPMEDGGGGDPSAARCSASWLEGMGAN